MWHSMKEFRYGRYDLRKELTTPWSEACRDKVCCRWRVLWQEFWGNMTRKYSLSAVWEERAIVF